MIQKFKFGSKGEGGRQISQVLKEADRARDEREWSAAADKYAEYLEYRPGDFSIRVQYGHSLKESGKLDEAECAYREACGLRPDDYEVFLHLAHLQKRMDKLTDARESFLRAFDLENGLGETFRELIGLGYSIAELRERGMAKGLWNADGAETELFCFDVSDLIQYFQNARVATGIQRVQIKIIESLIEEDDPSRRISIVSYNPLFKSWVQIPNSLFMNVTRAAAQGADVKEGSWTSVRDAAAQVINSSSPVKFKRGAHLINLGTSWWLKNYFLSVRNAKEEYDINYVPFVHDCIPALMPEHCVSALTQDFLAWIRGVFAHADYYLCNSNWTMNDLVKVGKVLTDSDQLPSAVIRLDGDARLSTPYREDEARAVLRKYGLKGDDFVLFVSTIESRKNHLMLFETWLRLIRTLGPRRVPKLVCVGNKGWKVDNALRFLNDCQELKGHVVVAHGISDSDLRALYKNCAMTVYPSLYEGWGLPVTEALCYEKIVVSSNSSSLPEAGGDNALYFDPLNATEFYEIFERILTDSRFRESAQKKAQSFSPRTWLNIAHDIQDTLNSHFQEMSSERRKSAAHIPELQQIYSFTEDRSGSLVETTQSAERFRVGEGWSTLDDVGCRMDQPFADLLLGKPEGLDGDAEIQLVILGLPSSTKDVLNYDFSINGRHVSVVSVSPAKRKICRLPVLASDWDANNSVRIGVHTDQSESLLKASGGSDSRIEHGLIAALVVSTPGDVDSRLAIMEFVLELS